MFRHHEKDDSSKQKRRRHNDCIHDEQPSPHPMPPFILQQAFLHAPYTFKLVNHIGAMNNTSSTVLNLKNGIYSMRSCPKTQALSLEGCLTSYLRALSQNPSVISISFLLLYFCTLSQNPSFIFISFLPLYFRTFSRNPSFISISFLPLFFRTLSQNPSFISISFLPLYFRTLSQNLSDAGRPANNYVITLQLTHL